jgi:hypothetical protein
VSGWKKNPGRAGLFLMGSDCPVLAKGKPVYIPL